MSPAGGTGLLQTLNAFPNCGTCRCYTCEVQVVSLGGNCLVACEIRARFGDGWFPFDWWISSPGGLLRLIEDDFSGLFDADRLQLVKDGLSVANLHYGILHHHDFPRDSDGRIILSSATVERNRPRFELLHRRWRALAGRVLFVRYYWSTCVPELASVNIAQEVPDIALLPALLDRVFPHLDYRVLVVDSNQEIEHDKLLFRRVEDFSQKDSIDAGNLAWPGNRAIWQRIFDSVPMPGGDLYHTTMAEVARTPVFRPP